MRLRQGLLVHRVDILRLTRTISEGKPTVAQTFVEQNLPCLLESMAPKNPALAQGWIGRASYTMTWTRPSVILAGDIVVFENTRHVVKTVRRDLQGHYYAAHLEMEAK